MNNLKKKMTYCPSTTIQFLLTVNIHLGDAIWGDLVDT